jgi:Skp family chaperone for outer membrane proteins
MRLFLLLTLVASAAAAQERQLVDEVVAVVDAHSVTLSELAAETRIHMVEQQGPQMAQVPLDRAILAASLRRLVEERIVLSEVERLKLFDLDHAEVESALARLRSRFPAAPAWEAFTHQLDMTNEEIGAVLARELRVVRYLDNRLKLAAQLRDSELDEAWKVQGGQGDRDALRQKLSKEKYERLLTELLAELRRRASVRIVDALDDPTRSIAERP